MPLAASPTTTTMLGGELANNTFMFHECEKYMNVGGVYCTISENAAIGRTANLNAGGGPWGKSNNVILIIETRNDNIEFSVCSKKGTICNNKVSSPLLTQMSLIWNQLRLILCLPHTYLIEVAPRHLLWNHLLWHFVEKKNDFRRRESTFGWLCVYIRNRVGRPWLKKKPEASVEQQVHKYNSDTMWTGYTVLYYDGTCNRTASVLKRHLLHAQNSSLAFSWAFPSFWLK